MKSSFRNAPFIVTRVIVARGLALFLGVFGLANFAMGLAQPHWDANAFWSGLPSIVLVPTCTALLAWSLAPRSKVTCTAGAIAALALAIGCALDAASVVQAERAGTVVAASALSLSAGLAALLLGVAAIIRFGKQRTESGETRPLRSLALVALFAGAWAGIFPLALSATLGQSDYRGPADAIVVFGARAYADGTLSHALEDRVSTGAELYREGHAPVVWMSGGPGDGAIHEVEAMRDAAVALGVPADHVQLDFEGWNTALTAKNLAPRLPTNGRVIAVSHGFHLARVRLAFARAGHEVVTVPADHPTRPLAKRARLIVRDAVGFWAYWLGYGVA